MNQRQALRAVVKRNEELENYNKRAAADIKQYNACIEHMIEGKSPCDFCEDQWDCETELKVEGKGCKEWMLKFPKEEDIK